MMNILNSLFYKEKTTAFLLWTLIFIAVVGVFSVGEYNYLPANAIFESVVILFFMVSIFPVVRGALFFVFSALIYLLVCFFIMESSSPAHVADFFMAYKSFYYVILLSFFIGKSKFTENDLKFIFYSLLFLFLIKYGYSRVFNISERPGVYTENNFELIFVLLIYYAIADALGKYKFICFAFLSLLVVLSGSRSAILALLVIYGFVFLSEINIKTIVFFLLLISLSVFIVVQRSVGGIEDIDRFIFLTVFIDEIKNWDLSNFIFGSRPLTPLSYYSCTALSFYESLFSFSGDGRCYSVILHSYLLRLIFDHGVAGLVFIFSFVVYGMMMAGYKMKQIVCVVGVIISTGLSVSSMNSIYVAMALLIIFSYPKNKCESI